MFFHSALGKPHGRGDLAIGAAVHAAEQEDVAGALRQLAQSVFYELQCGAGLHRLFGRWLRIVVIGQQRAQGAAARVLAAQVIDGEIARAAQDRKSVV